MILKKILTEGKEAYVPVDLKEATELAKQGGALLFTDEKEQQTFYEALNKQKNILNDEITQDINKMFSDGELAGSAEEMAVKISSRIEDKFSDFNPDYTFYKKEKTKTSSKTAKLLNVLPFLDESDCHELIQQMLDGKESLKDISLSAVLPFLSEEDCDALFLKAVKDGNWQFSLSEVAPFVSDACLSNIVDLYIEGKFPEEEMDTLYPYLSSRDIKRVFQYIVNKKEE